MAFNTRPLLKKRYRGHLEKVREFVDSVAYFDELIFPNPLCLHFLGPESSTHVLKRLETNRKKMATCFSKKKLAEMKEKKDKSIPEEGGFISKRRRLEKKVKDGVIEKPEVVLQPAIPSSPHPHSPSSSLKVLPSSAYEAISIEDLKPLMSKPSNELMSSHIHRVMQVLGESLYLSRKNMDYEEKYVLAQSKVESVSSENASLAEQLEAALGKIEEAQTQATVDFKNSDEYDDKLCALYVDGFDLVHAYVKKHHLEIDLSTLDIEEVEIETIADWAAVAQANDVADEEAEAPIDDPVSLVNPVDPV
ncbi:hypothetical protein SO802_031614 [Lithocarpus litseifolius]|uniref:Uncharacterized protein n=1 Tax=Lithocarpus litseifolius TaxID=425828 RepID=A0AAW2BM28_9ROSI